MNQETPGNSMTKSYRPRNSEKEKKALMDRLKRTSTNTEGINLEEIQSNLPNFINSLDEIYNIINYTVKPIAKKCEYSERRKLTKKKENVLQKYNLDAISKNQTPELKNRMEETRRKFRETETAISRIQTRQIKF